ncbi:hypothetical protein Btru_041142 [Bulinus truncatus]|nr:hypothetical protein Btru_041142 [Bulinus truncatus]
MKSPDYSLATKNNVWLTTDYVWLNTDYVWLTTDYVWLTTDYVWLTTDYVDHICGRLLSWTINNPDVRESIDKQSEKILCVHFGLSQTEDYSDEEDDQSEVDKKCKQFFNQFNVHHVSEEKLGDFVKNINFPKAKKKRSAEIKRQSKADNVGSIQPKLPPRSITKDILLASCNNLYVNSQISEKGIINKLKQLQEEVKDEINEESNTFYLSASGKKKIFGRHVYHNHEGVNLMDISEVSSFNEIKDILNVVLRNNEKLLINLKFLTFKVLPELSSSNCVHGLTTLSTCDYPTLQSECLDILELIVFNGKVSVIHLDDHKLGNCLEILMEYIVHVRSLINKKVVNKRMLDTIARLEKFLNLSIKELKTIVKHSKDLNTENSTKKLCKYNEEIQFYLLIELIKQLFKTAKETVLPILEECLQQSGRFLRPRSSCSPFGVQLIQRGLGQFVQYMAKHLNHADLNELCSAVLTLLQTSQKMDERTFQDVLHSLRPMQVCPVKFIREHILKLVYVESGHMLREIPELVNIVEKMWFPIFLIDLTKQKTQSDSKNGWAILSGTFNGSPVSLHLHIPSFDDHLQSNKTEFLCEEDQNVLKHFQTVQKLKHGHIVTLYSYNLNEIPQFFIIEQSAIDMCRNLQEYLLNKKLNQSFCSLFELFNMLIQAADALVYCHDNNIIHGNITLKHFILTSPGCIKLTDFHMATSVKDTPIVVLDSEQQQEIPTLYSAPESLRRGKISKKSDVWMFACFTNSVLNHGELIPCDLTLTDEEIYLRILMSTFELSWPKFVTMESMQIIKSCFSMNSDQRPSMEDTCDKLGKYMLERRQDYSSERVTYKYCKHYSRGNINLFRSELQNVSPHLCESIKNGKLDHIVPFVRCVTRSHKRCKLEVRIPFQLSGNIIEMLKTKRVGHPDTNFNELIVQIANIVKSLHMSNFVIGEITPDQLFIEKLVYEHHCKIKVHLISMPYLTTVPASFKQNLATFSIRMAPEIREHKMFTFAGDVYSIGCLLWDLWHARIISQNCIEAGYRNTDLFGFTDDHHSTKPKSMSQEFFDFLKRCTHKDMDQRPTMDEIIRKFSPFRTNSGETNSQEGTSTHNDLNKPQFSLTPLNPSPASSTISEEHDANDIVKDENITTPGVSEEITIRASENDFTTNIILPNELSNPTDGASKVADDYEEDIYDSYHIVEEKKIIDSKENFYDNDLENDIVQTETYEDIFYSSEEEEYAEINPDEYQYNDTAL